MRKKISAVIITKNEEDKIKECINSLQFCDEILVIDNNSSDKTRVIANELGAKVFILEKEDFSELRNFGLNKSLEDWILYVDADERISKELSDEIVKVLDKPKNNISVYILRRKNFYFGNNEWPNIEKMERLFLKEKLKGWKGKLHESPIFDGKTKELESFLLHYTHRDLSSMVAKTLDWSKIEADLRFNNHHPKITWWRFPRVMFSAFYDSYISQGGWRVGTVGIIESFYQAFSIFITYARLWELQKKLKIKNEK